MILMVYGAPVSLVKSHDSDLSNFMVKSLQCVPNKITARGDRLRKYVSVVLQYKKRKINNQHIMPCQLYTTIHSHYIQS